MRTLTGPGAYYIRVTGQPASSSEDYALTLAGSTITTPHAVAGDFNGDSIADIAVYRSATGTWRIRNQADVQFGDRGDIPVPGDYNGDNAADIAVYRPSTGMWYVRNQFAVQFGEPGDVPIPGDYNGDHVTDIAVYRPSTGFWYVRNQFAIQYGERGDRPVPADFNGDGAADIAVYRPGFWFVRGQFAAAFGERGRRAGARRLRRRWPRGRGGLSSIDRRLERAQPAFETARRPRVPPRARATTTTTESSTWPCTSSPPACGAS